MIDVHKGEYGIIVEVSGKITTEQAEEFHEAMLRLVDEHPGRFLMDMAGVEYLCSSGVGTVAQVLKFLRERGDDLFICSLNESLHTLFRVTRLSRIIEIFDSRAQGEGRLEAGANLE